MNKEYILFFGIVAVGYIIIKLIANELKKRRYKDGSTKTPFKHPPNKL